MKNKHQHQQQQQNKNQMKKKNRSKVQKTNKKQYIGKLIKQIMKKKNSNQQQKIWVRVSGSEFVLKP
jgi:hypothetical protein